MDPAGWTISIIAIVIVAAIALNISRKSKRAADQNRRDHRD
jgi:hypothetical protein